jgi:signal transduction histidine kinase
MADGLLDRLKRRRWPAAAVLAMLLVPANFALAVRSGLPLWNEDAGLFPQSVGLLLGFAAISAFITLRRPRLLVGKLLVVVCLGELARQLTFSYAYVGLISKPGSLAGAALSSWLSQAVFAYPGTVALMVWIPLLFPDGRPPSRWLRPLVWAGFAPILSTLVIGAVVWNRRGTEFLVGPDPHKPFPPLAALLNRWTITFVLTWAPWLALASIVLRYLRSDASTRRQLRWFAIAAVTIAIAALGEFVPEPRSLRLVNSLPWVPAAIAIAVVRERLYGIDVVIRRSVVYGGLLGGIVAIYAGVVWGASALLGVGGPVPSLGATVLVAILFQPAKQRLEHLAERVVFGGRRDPAAALARLGVAVQGTAESVALPDLCRTVMDAARLVGASITTRTGLSGAAGSDAGATVHVPLIHQGEDVGRLTVRLAPGERRLSKAEDHVVSQLAPLLASTVHALALAHQLRSARERLVTTREEERRRLRRDLHDGLGPALAAITMEIQAARALLAVDRGGADTVLQSAEDSARGAIREIRRVVHGLRPPILDQLGLVRAIQEHAGSIVLDAPGRSFDVAITSSGELDVLPAAGEVAAYMIVLEALTNVVRHSGAHRCTIDIRVDDQLRIEVSDDGTGLPREFHQGVGLQSMRERAEELGGSLTIDPSEAGVRVVARIPLADVI